MSKREWKREYIGCCVGEDNIWTVPLIIFFLKQARLRSANMLRRLAISLKLYDVSPQLKESGPSWTNLHTLCTHVQLFVLHCKTTWRHPGLSFSNQSQKSFFFEDLPTDLQTYETRYRCFLSKHKKLKNWKIIFLMSFLKNLNEIFLEYCEVCCGCHIFQAGLWPKMADKQYTVSPRKHPVISVAKHCVTVVTEL